MKNRLIAILTLLVFAAFLIKIMVLKDMPLVRIGTLMLNFGGTHEGPANVIPFKTILPYLFGDKGLIIAGINIVGNIVLLVPIGFLIPILNPKIHFKNIIIWAIASGLVIEGMQVILHVGIFDIDDVILNGFGVLIGYWLYLIYQKLMLSKEAKYIKFTALIVLLALLGFLVNSYHENGRFPISIEKDMMQNPIRLQDPTKPMQDQDPCGGTGGTGKIVNIGDRFITIQRKDGVSQNILITDKTIIKNALSPIGKNDLKIGNHVTVVTIDEKMTASAILVCNESNNTSLH